MVLYGTIMWSNPRGRMSLRHYRGRFSKGWGIGLCFAVGIGVGILAWRMTAAITKRKEKKESRTIKTLSDKEVIDLLEERIQRDEGGRGIKEICLKGELYSAALEILNPDVVHVTIMTGFPCMLDFYPPTETDGPLGALAIARCCLASGKSVTLITDDCNGAVLLQATRASDLNSDYLNRLSLQSFGGGSSFSEECANRLYELYFQTDLIIAIERAGPCHDDSYRTMKKRDMTEHVAHLDMMLPAIGRTGETCASVFSSPESSDARHLGLSISEDSGDFPQKKTPRSIGIGDGGNEVGMGKIYDKIVNSSILNAKDIACVTVTDHLIVCSVSNWGGYALAAAVAVLSTPINTNNSDVNNNDDLSNAISNLSLEWNRAKCSEQKEGAVNNLDGYDESKSLYPAVNPSTYNQTKTKRETVNITRDFAVMQCMPSAKIEKDICQAMIEEGARDGITGKNELYVDGMPLDVSIQVLEDLRKIATLNSL